MSNPADLRAQIEAELERTAFQRKAVAHGSPDEVMDEAIAFFIERGYRSGRTGRPNQIFVRGGREGALPRVNAEILVQPNVGKRRVTMLSISGAGEQLSQVLQEYVTYLRDKARQARG